MRTTTSKRRHRAYRRRRFDASEIVATFDDRSVTYGLATRHSGPLSTLPLKVAAGRLVLLPSSIVCQLKDGTQTIVCTIARQVLRDLGDYHFRRAIPEEAVFSECLSEIERLANAKFRGRSLDQNGEISIGSADLARFGFGGALQFGIAAE